MADNHADFMVLGAGRGGYACAFRAVDLGRKVVLADPRATLSAAATCLTDSPVASRAFARLRRSIESALPI